MTHNRVAAVKVERRNIGVAVFDGTRIEYVEHHHLSSASHKAESSALGFVHWIVSNFKMDSIALEEVDGNGSRRAVLSGLIADSLRRDGIFIWKVKKKALFQAFALPPAQTRKEVREIVRTIWPILEERKEDLPNLDAVALGLYVQTERLFAY